MKPNKETTEVYRYITEKDRIEREYDYKKLSELAEEALTAESRELFMQLSVIMSLAKSIYEHGDKSEKKLIEKWIKAFITRYEIESKSVC